MFKMDTSGLDNLMNNLDNLKEPMEVNIGELLIETLGEIAFNDFELKCEAKNIEVDSDEFYLELDKVIKSYSKYSGWDDLIFSHYSSKMFG